MNEISSSRISVIIPHYNNKDILYNCIYSLHKATYNNYQIIVVDNNSTDNSVEEVKKSFPAIKILKSKKNLGYAGGCNIGAEVAKSDYLLFLNNDTVHNHDFIEPLVKLLDDNPSIASVQPKIMNMDKKHFDYAGASGGYIDYLVFPYSRGRIFNSIEQDHNQYNDKKEIFWASGACFLTRKSIFDSLGGFDEKLFAHMEEIDFHWKIHMINMSVYVEPKSIIYHKGGATLNYKSSQKLYLNHRNSLILLLTNYSLSLSLYLFPIKIILEIISSIKELLCFRLINFFNHYKAILWIIFNFNFLVKRRKKNKMIRKISDKILFEKDLILSRSIVYLYFILRIKKYSDLK